MIQKESEAKLLSKLVKKRKKIGLFLRDFHFLKPWDFFPGVFLCDYLDALLVNNSLVKGNVDGVSSGHKVVVVDDLKVIL